MAWFVLAAVEELDLAAFYAAYREDGHGRAAHDPAMMVALFLYAYCNGQRSSRGIERACVENVAFRVIAGNQVPDHTTIARFRQRHETAIGELFTKVLGMCADAGLAKVGVVAIDGTKVAANASGDANLDYGQIAKRILEEAAEIDRQEDEQFGEKRGDELPEELSTEHGRRAWLREAQHRLNEKRGQEAKPIPTQRPQRLQESKRRLEEELWTECRANEAYEAYRARGVMKDGRRFGGPPKPYQPPRIPTGTVNITDPDSRLMKTTKGFVQGYNVQAATNDHQIVIAAEVRVSSPDFGNLGPIVDAALSELVTAGVADTPEVVVADAGYWHSEQMENVINQGIQVLIPPDSRKRKGTRPGWDGGAYAFMRRVLSTDLGRELYGKRKEMIEPVFGHTKHNRRIDRFQRRGRSAARSEWRLITATHNLMKLHKHQLALTAALRAVRGRRLPRSPLKSRCLPRRPPPAPTPLRNSLPEKQVPQRPQTNPFETPPPRLAAAGRLVLGCAKRPWRSWRCLLRPRVESVRAPGEPDPLT